MLERGIEKGWSFALALLQENKVFKEGQIYRPVKDDEKTRIKSAFGRAGIKLISADSCLSSASAWKDWRREAEIFSRMGAGHLQPARYAELGTYGFEIPKRAIGLYSYKDLESDDRISNEPQLQILLRAMWRFARSEYENSKRYRPETCVAEVRAPDRAPTIAVADPFFLSDLSRSASGLEKSAEDFWRQAVSGGEFVFAIKRLSELYPINPSEKFDLGVRRGNELEVLLVRRHEMWPKPPSFELIKEPQPLGFTHIGFEAVKRKASEKIKPERRVDETAEKTIIETKVEEIDDKLRNYTYAEKILKKHKFKKFKNVRVRSFGTYFVRNKPTQDMLQTFLEEIGRSMKQAAETKTYYGNLPVGVCEFNIGTQFGTGSEKDVIESLGLLIVDSALDLGQNLKDEELNLEYVGGDKWHKMLRFFLMREGRIVGKFVNIPDMPEKDVGYMLVMSNEFEYKIIKVRKDKEGIVPVRQQAFLRARV